MCECGLPSSGIIEVGLQVLLQCRTVTLLSCHIHLQRGKRPHGEGFSPVLLIYQGSAHKQRRKQHCFIQINYVPEEENVEKQHLA